MVLLCTAFAQAQRTVNGTVTDRSGEPLIGASVLLKGTTTGTITDLDGTYSLRVPAGTDQVLVISYTGFEQQEVTLGVSNVVDVALEESSQILSEVVVTALGFETKRSKVGVASSTVEGGSLARSGEVGLLNSLAGKSAGLQVISSSGEPGAGSQLRIRGATSITGNIQPLIVVDGVPIFNDTYYGQGWGGQQTSGSGSIGSGGGVTQQSRLNDINPEDIESVQVLRGASAAAVWGSRAANGVLVITTKKGKYKQNKAWTIDVNSSVAFDELNKKVELNETYGQGIGGLYAFVPPGGLSWGDKIADRKGGQDAFITEGQPGYQGKFVADGTGNTYYAIADGDETNPHGGKNDNKLYDMYDYLFQTGVTYSNAISLSNADEKGNVYFSLAQLNQEGTIVSNSNYERTTARLNASRRIGKFTIEGGAGYTYSTSERVQMGSNLAGLFLGGLREPAGFDGRDYLGTYYAPDGFIYPNRQRAYRNPLGARLNATYNNPLYTANEVESDNVVNRFIGKGEIRYEPLNWLNFIARVGVDAYSDERSDFFPYNSAGENNLGRFTKETITRRQVNADLIARARFDLTKDIAMNALLGSGLNMNKLDDQGSTTRNFVNPFSPPQLSNGGSVPFNYFEEVRTTGIYSTLGFEFFDQVFLNLSGRQDFLSTLPEADNGVFYPAADVSWQLSKLLPANSPLSSARLRAGYGQVGRGPDPYLTKQTFAQPTSASVGWGESWSPGIDVNAYGGGFAVNTVAANADIKPEIKTETEAGLDLGFLKDRLNLGATVYQNTTKDLIIQVALPESSGYVNQISNAGEIKNKGFELEWNLVPIRKDDFEWNIYGNFTKNKNEVVSLAGTTNIILSGFSGTTSSAVPGYQLGVIYGSMWERDANKNLVLDEDGFPQQAPTLGVIADPNPDFRLGAGTGLSYKGFRANVLFDMSQGGEFWNGTKGALAFFGRAKFTDVETNLTADQANSLPIFGGATVADAYPYLQNADGTYTVRGEIKNFGGGDVFLDESWYYNGPGSGFTGPDEQFIEDASWFRLREVSLSYTFRKDMLKIKWLENATLSVTGRNLILWTDYTGNDPDTNLTGSGLNGIGLDYFQNPSSRTYKVALNLTF